MYGEYNEHYLAELLRRAKAMQDQTEGKQYATLTDAIEKLEAGDTSLVPILAAFVGLTDQEYLYEFQHDEVIDLPERKYGKDSEGRFKHWKSLHRKVLRWRANVRDNLRGPG